MLEELPRDLQLRVFRALLCRNMDARIQAGLVFRLRVPAEIAERIGRALVKPLESTTVDGSGTLVRRVTAVAFPAAPSPRFMLRQVYMASPPSVQIHGRNILSFPGFATDVHTVWWESSAYPDSSSST
jgi:hypothetical protein